MLLIRCLSPVLQGLREHGPREKKIIRLQESEDTQPLSSSPRNQPRLHVRLGPVLRTWPQSTLRALPTVCDDANNDSFSCARGSKSGSRLVCGSQLRAGVFMLMVRGQG